MPKINTPPQPPDKPEDTWVDTKSPDTVREMFTSISPTYDALNHILSLNTDKRWRRALARETLAPDTRRILDVCGGTGDLSQTLAQSAAKLGAAPTIICSDFTPAMVAIARDKFQATGGTSPLPLVADTTCLPFADAQFDLVTVAFGIRNVVDPAAGLAEMARVLRPGGAVAVLEFSRTRSWLINGGFNIYFRHILPAIGRIVTKSRAYHYLSKSVEKFPEGEEFCRMVSAATGSPTTAKRLSFGIATLYISRKA